jgi:hypothetical protein
VSQDAGKVSWATLAQTAQPKITSSRNVHFIEYYSGEFVTFVSGKQHYHSTQSHPVLYEGGIFGKQMKISEWLAK